KSIVWLLLSAVAAIVLSILFGLIFRLFNNTGSVFEGTVSEATVNAYSGLTTSIDKVFLNLFPSNIVSDLAENNVVAIIIIAAAFALAYISVAKEEGEDKVSAFKNLVEAAKKIVYKILSFVIDLTPYAVFCLIAGSASKIFTNIDAILSLLVLLGVIYLVALVHTYGYNALVLRFVAKVNPFKFFRKTARAQATAFTTQSSVGTLPITIGDLKGKVGVDEEVANFTAPLGTTIGMPGCTCVWPVLLVLFYVNAIGLNWGVGDYIILGILTLILSFGSAGVPGIALVSSIALFQVLGLPVSAVVLLIPINTISDMVRTLDNVASAATATAVVARKTNNLNDEIFNKQTEVIKSGAVAEEAKR
ncbi:MAG: dicarboxylate/amino acid:cation symporter, partial [Clostridia bacterium]|nr:dicarboxylate/amino acid:cation symporter [Clostridia bacterium]